MSVPVTPILGITLADPHSPESSRHTGWAPGIDAAILAIDAAIGVLQEGGGGSLEFAALSAIAQEQGALTANLKSWVKHSGYSAASFVNDVDGSTPSGNIGGAFQSLLAISLSANLDFVGKNTGGAYFAVTGGSLDGTTPYSLDFLNSAICYGQWDGPGRLGVLAGMHFEPYFLSAGNITLAAGAYFRDTSEYGGGADTAAAIWIADQTAGSFAFKSGLGPVEIGGDIGFYGHAAAAKPAVIGSRGANAALASLLTALSGLGLLTDSSS